MIAIATQHTALVQDFRNDGRPTEMREMVQVILEKDRVQNFEKWLRNHNIISPQWIKFGDENLYAEIYLPDNLVKKMVSWSE